MWRTKISISFLVLFVCFSCSKIEKVQIDISSTECLMEVEIEHARKWFLIDESSALNIQIDISDGIDSKSKKILFFNEGNDTLNFFSTKDAYFKRAKMLIPIEKSDNGNGSLWVNYNTDQLAYLSCLEKNKYSISRVYERDHNFIFLTFFNANKILPNEGLEIEIKFEKEGSYQLILEFNPKIKHESQWGLNSVKAIYSPVFNIP